MHVRRTHIMKSQFIEQVQILMDVQNIKNAEKLVGKSNYMWLCTKRTTLIWISTKDEFMIRQALTKITSDQQIQVMKQLLTWLDDNPNASSLKIPEVTLELINTIVSANVLKESTFSRMNSFRSSLRRFSTFSNKFKPSSSAFLNVEHEKPRRSVTFNDVPTIFK